MIAVIGYASLDHAMAVERFLGPTGTTLVRRRLSRPWPDHGGFAHVTRALRAGGVPAEAVSWLGPDRPGQEMLDRLHADGVGIEGVVTAGSRTASTYLFYAADGGATCVYDPGDATADRLTDRQREVVAGADWLVVTVAPAGATEGALDAIGPDVRVAWTVKPDPDAYPPALVRRMLDRAEVVTYGAAEESFLESTAGGFSPASSDSTLVVRTAGGSGARYWQNGVERSVPGELISGVDTTGAGDTFVGALVAALARNVDAGQAVRAATDAAGALLRRRAEQGGDGNE